MTTLRYISHPNVEVDAAIAVPRWGLNDEGRSRTRSMLQQPWVSWIGRIVSSDETKALETAEILAAHLGLRVEIRPGIGENDRSATGFVPPPEFEELADAFFARPDESVQGWERAIDAQARIVSKLADLLDSTSDTPTANTDIAVIGHGGVGTLWYCHLTGQPIDRTHDQSGQGNYYSVDLHSKNPIHAWRPIDHID